MKTVVTLITCLCFSICTAQNTITIFDTTNSGIPSNSVTSLKFDNTGKLWVGTSDAGLGVYDKSANSWTYYNLNNTPQLGSNHISDIQQHPNGDMWFATLNGISHNSSGTWTLFDSTIIPNYKNELSIRIDSKGNVYTKSLHLHKFDGSSMQMIDTLNFYTRSSKDFAIDNNDNIWTVSGHRFDGINWTRKFFGGQVENAIEIDNDGNIVVVGESPHEWYLTVIDTAGNTKNLILVDDTSAFGGYTFTDMNGMLKNDKSKNKMWVTIITPHIYHAYNDRAMRWVQNGQFGIDSNLNSATTGTHVKCLEFDDKGNTWIGVSKIDGYPRAKSIENKYGGIVIYNENGVDLSGFPLGVDRSNSKQLSLSIYPNPANSIISVNIAANKSTYLARILDMQGKLLHEKQLAAAGGQLNIDNLPTGVYLIDLLDVHGKSVYSERFIKQ